MTISALHGGFASDNPGDIWNDAALKIAADAFGIQNIGEDACPNDFNFYARDRLPNHVLELYDKFTRFIGLFYKFLECEQSLGYLGVLKDIDETPDILVKLFKDVYAAGFPDTVYVENEEEGRVASVDFLNPSASKLNVRNFLRYVRDFYQLKSVEGAYDFFFRAFFNEEVSISYPKIYLHKCSEGAYLGASAGYTADPHYYWGDRFAQVPSKYENYPDCRDETLENPLGNCIPIPFPEYGPTGPCYFNSNGNLCWGAGGSFDAEGNLLFPPCDPGCAPGSPHGVYYKNDFGSLSGFSRIHDNKTWQNYSYLLDSAISWNSYKDYVRSLLHPAGLYLAGNYNVYDEFPQPGTTGEAISMEQPVVGNYTPYRFNTSVNLRDNENEVDLYPCGYNPYIRAHGVSYESGHLQDTKGLWYKDEAGATAHQSKLTPLGICGGTGGLDAALMNLSFFRIFHHPNTWTTTVPEDLSFKDLELGMFFYLEAINKNTGSPNNAAESSSVNGCGF